MQLMGRGGRGPTIHESSLEIIWNNSDLSLNVPGNRAMFCIVLTSHDISGMTSDVRRVLGQEGCIAEKLCQIFSYKFTRKNGKCCSNCDVVDGSSM